MIYALAITGPTASGKTAISIEVAKELGCEIISLDSMQLYKGMDIGTAKATAEEKAAVPHHMIDLIDPNETFSAKAYREEAMRCARDICARGKTPLFVGGTGLYLSTLLRPECEEAPESNPEYRSKIESTLKTEDDRIALWERLNSIDPEAASAVHYNNTRRVIRAIEIFDATGKTKTYFDMLTHRKNDEISINHITFDFHDRDTLYERVDRRVDEMMHAGLTREVEELLAKGFLSGETTAAQAIGYKEIVAAKKSGLSQREATEEIKQASRNYAKRQLTWFRHTDGANRIYIDFEDGTLKPKETIIAECLFVFKNSIML